MEWGTCLKNKWVRLKVTIFFLIKSYAQLPEFFDVIWTEVGFLYFNSYQTLLKKEI